MESVDAGPVTKEEDCTRGVIGFFFFSRTQEDLDVSIPLTRITYLYAVVASGGSL